MDFFTFLENAPRVLGVPRGSQGVPWGIYHTKTKLWAPEKDLSGSRRPILTIKWQKIKKIEKKIKKLSKPKGAALLNPSS